ncbi:glycine zipper domain-containing protein [Pontibacter locisalis]|uniref:Glycine zipper domain-containing protein n=1 Tax=Pontibacter locisalis TaxID=1719035 RepID=A0ABW5IGE9_9BACT
MSNIFWHGFGITDLITNNIFDLKKSVMKKVSLILSLVLLVTFAFNNSAEAQKKWSPQAKGAVIGTATGAAAGAVIHKRNRVIGGVVGGVVGGAAGYGIGKHIDNKQKEREAERIAAIERAEANRAASERAAARRAEANRSVANNTKAVSNKRVASRAEAAPAKQIEAADYPAVHAYASYNTQDPIMSIALLPNLDYGDPTKPYYTSEYRRKSW